MLPYYHAFARVSSVMQPAEGNSLWATPNYHFAYTGNPERKKLLSRYYICQIRKLLPSLVILDLNRPLRSHYLEVCLRLRPICIIRYIPHKSCQVLDPVLHKRPLLRRRTMLYREALIVLAKPFRKNKSKANRGNYLLPQWFIHRMCNSERFRHDFLVNER